MTTNTPLPAILRKEIIEAYALRLARAALEGTRADVLAIQEEIEREHGQAMLHAANSEWPYTMLELMRQRYEANKHKFEQRERFPANGF